MVKQTEKGYYDSDRSYFRRGYSYRGIAETDAKLFAELYGRKVIVVERPGCPGFWLAYPEEEGGD